MKKKEYEIPEISEEVVEISDVILTSIVDGDPLQDKYESIDF